MQDALSSPIFRFVVTLLSVRIVDALLDTPSGRRFISNVSGADDQKELATWLQLNKTALDARKAGSQQLQQAQRALRDGNAPHLSHWVHDEGYSLESWETDWSSQTGACQAGLLHGDNDDIPAFRWWEKDRGAPIVTNHPKDAAEIERRHSNGRGLLHEDVVVYADGGGRVRTARRPVVGADHVVRLYLGLRRKLPAFFSDARLTAVNGGPAILIRREYGNLRVMTIEVADGRVAAIYDIANPEKLRFLEGQLAGTTRVGVE